jgi:hypothetical protein
VGRSPSRRSWIERLRPVEIWSEYISLSLYLSLSERRRTATQV